MREIRLRNIEGRKRDIRERAIREKEGNMGEREKLRDKGTHRLTDREAD